MGTIHIVVTIDNMFIIFLLSVQVLLGSCQGDIDSSADKDGESIDIITVIKNMQKNITKMEQQNEKRDTMMVELIKSVQHQGKEIEKRDAIMTDLMKVVQNQGKEMSAIV